MAVKTHSKVLNNIILHYLKGHGFSAYAIENITDRIIETISGYRSIPLKQRAFALRHGFFAEKIILYGLNEQNYKDYLSDLDYFWLHPLNGGFSHWIDDKLTLRYLLAPFSNYLPGYYYQLSTSGVAKLQDCPDEFSADERGILKLLRLKSEIAGKPLIGTAGLGFFKLSCHENLLYVNDTRVSEQELINLFSQWRLSETGYIITEYLHPHPDLGRIWSKTANSLRITVLRGSDNQAKIAYAFTRFGNSTSGVVENSVAGGIFNFIDLKTGEYNQGKIWRNDQIIDCAVHPESGVPVCGVVPYWESIKQKLIDISDFIPQLHYLGFDVVVVENGFKIIEINSQPSHEFFQWFLPAYQSDVIGPFFREMLERKRLQVENGKKARSTLNNYRNAIYSHRIFKIIRAMTSTRKTKEAFCELLKASELFDEQWYIEKYHEVIDPGMEPVLHYLSAGAERGYDPGPEFSSKRYLEAYADVQKEGMNPLVHYVMYGRYEGRAIFKHE